MNKPITMTSSDEKPGVEDRHGMTPEDWKHLDEMTDEEIAAAAATDPDTPLPKMGPGPTKARRLSLAKLVRQKVRLSREHFAEAYSIPLETLDAWERHELKPTPVEEAYLRLIEREPDRAKLTPVK